MLKKALIVTVALIGALTFFLPLVRVRAPLVGEQRISGWDAVKQAQQKKKRNDLSLDETLNRLQAGVLQQKRQQAPLALRQAEALPYTLPAAYVSLVLTGVLAALSAVRGVQVSGVLGFLAGAFSLASVFWLNIGIKQMVGGGSAGHSPLGALRRSVAQQVEVSPEIGLYLLVATLTALLLASFLPGVLPQRRSSAPPGGASRK
ncbi:MAG: hypothetical protein ACRD35_09060 [Candidatus Acidiferrales bacterium]